MKILRLSPTDARTWRENRSILIDENGDCVRPILLAETRVLSELQKKCRATRQQMEVDFKQTTPAGEVTTHIAVMFRDLGPRSTVMVSLVDGYEVIDGRDFFQRQVLKVHGECQLRSHTGQFMKAVRDPNFQRPTAKDAQRHAPRPEHCNCKSWGSHPGRHHSICEWNLKAPLEEQALPDEASTTIIEQRLLPETHRRMEKPSILDVQTPRKNAAESRTAAVAAAPVPVAPRIPHPDVCQCKDFAMPNTGEKRPDGVHHPICQFREAWEASSLPKMFLMNVSTGQITRHATSNEIRASGEKGYITIGDEQYGVVPESEVELKRVAPSAAE